MSSGIEGPKTERTGGIPQEVGAGVFLLALAAIGLYGGLRLNFGKLSEIGPGLFPISMSVLVGIFGLFLVGIGLTRPGEMLSRWNVRGLTFVLLSILFFALFIRGMTIEMFGGKFQIPALGLLVCVPVCVVLSAYADAETKFTEVLIFGIFMMLLCGFMFKDMLSLPIPFDPMGLIPEPIAQAYAGFKKSVVSFVLSLFGRR